MNFLIENKKKNERNETHQSACICESLSVELSSVENSLLSRVVEHSFNYRVSSVWSFDAFLSFISVRLFHYYFRKIFIFTQQLLFISLVVSFINSINKIDRKKYSVNDFHHFICTSRCRFYDVQHQTYFIITNHPFNWIYWLKFFTLKCLQVNAASEYWTRATN